MKRKLFFHGFLLLGLSFSLFSQDTVKVPGLVTDRPTQSESPVIVPAGFLQIETGFMHEFVKLDVENIFYNTTLLRYGLVKGLEIRLGMDYLKNVERLNGDDTQFITKGFTPVFISSKLHIARERGIWPEVAFSAGVGIPKTGAGAYMTSHLAPSLKVIALHTIGRNFSLGYNIVAAWDGETAKPTGIYTVSLGIALSEDIGVFIENYAYFKKGLFDFRSDAGITWLIKRNLQVDLSGGLGLNHEASNCFISCGISWRVPH